MPNGPAAQHLGGLDVPCNDATPRRKNVVQITLSGGAPLSRSALRRRDTHDPRKSAEQLLLIGASEGCRRDVFQGSLVED